MPHQRRYRAGSDNSLSPDSRRHTVEGPWITPARPALQPLRAGEDVPETEPSDPEQLGETSDHHKIVVISQKRNQRLALAIRHQRQEGLIADHQGEALQQRFERGATPQLTRGVMRIADPEHGRIRW